MNFVENECCFQVLMKNLQMGDVWYSLMFILVVEMIEKNSACVVVKLAECELM